MVGIVIGLKKGIRTLTEKVEKLEKEAEDNLATISVLKAQLREIKAENDELQRQLKSRSANPLISLCQSLEREGYL